MYERYTTAVLRTRLLEPRSFIQVITGPRQVGKTTSVRQALESSGLPYQYATADSPTPLQPVWISTQWNSARAEATANGSAVLALDEIQKIHGWSEVVKAEWDADTAADTDVRVILSGSSALLVHQGLSESLAGRFELTRATHWIYSEMRDAFAWDVDTFVVFGGYPGAAQLAEDADRWRAYLLDSLVETAVARDVLALARVDKPALMRRLFALACEYSGRELSYNKMLGQLVDAGNTTTLAHYLDLLSAAGLAMGLHKYAGEAVRKRASSPKLLVPNTGLVTAVAGLDPSTVRQTPDLWGRLVETAVGAHLVALCQRHGGELRYWRDGGLEVDYVHERPGGDIVAIEVKSGRTAKAEGLKGLHAFAERFSPTASLVVGTTGVSLEDFLGRDQLPV